VPIPPSLEFPQRVDHANASMVLADLTNRLQQVGDGAPVVLGLKALAHFDSSALSVLLALKRHDVTSGQSLQITEWPHKLLDLVEAYGLKAALQADTD